MGKEKNQDSAKGAALWLFVILLLLLIILGGIMLIQKKNNGNAANAEIASDTAVVMTDAAVTETQATETSQPETEAVLQRSSDFSRLELDSDTVLLTDLEGNEYFSKNKDKKMCPASLTKIMTAIVALESLDDIDEKIIITGDIYNQVVAENGSTAGFVAYEEVSYRDMLYGAILCSGSECCLTIANYIAGCEWNYVQLMNEKADEIGMADTHFTNVCGFHDNDHYSTAADMSLLLNYALKNDTFYEIFTSRSYYAETDERGIELSSTMFSQMDSPDVNGGKILGGKTGFTDEAGLCLASLAEVNGKLYTLITAGAPGSHYTEPMHINDTKKIYDKLGE